MGNEGDRTLQEDEYCATYIENGLLGVNSDFNKMVEVLRTGDGARLLYPQNRENSPASDFDYCLDLNRFGFILRIRTDDKGRNFFERVDV